MKDFDINSWIDFAKTNNFSIILILKDLEDGEIYPVYFKTLLEINRYKKNIISESKIKEIKTIWI